MINHTAWAIVVSLVASSADTEQVRLVPEFDAKTIPAMAPDQPAPIARVFDRYIYPADVKVPETGWDEATGQRLSGLLLRPVLERVLQDKRLAADDAEVDAFVAAMTSGDAPAELAGYREIGQHIVSRWKLNRALYQRYGGAVIFQQADPMEPVGAYAAWIRDLQAARIVEVYSVDARPFVWHYFERKHPFTVSGDAVNFDVPWWRQIK